MLNSYHLTPTTLARLHEELRESVEKQLHVLPQASGTEGSRALEDVVTRNLQEQLQLSEQVRMDKVLFGLRCPCHLTTERKMHVP